MLSSINPLGERARRQRFGVTVIWYLLGSALGGATLGTLAGWGGSLVPSGWWRGFAIVGVSVLGAGLDLAGVTPISLRRQVNENWLVRYRGWVYGLGFGFQLGLGVVTIVTTASIYTFWAVSFLLGSPLLGAVLGAGFGLARAALIALVARAGEPQALRRVMRRLQGRLPLASRAVVGAQLLMALAAMSLIR